jgi:glutaredoxin-like YruB-family protein
MSTTLQTIKNIKDLDKLTQDHQSFFAVAFISDASEKSGKAASLLKKISAEKKDTPLAVVNVSKTRSIHGKFGVTSVPTVITLKKGKLIKKLEGLQSEETYRVLLANAPRKMADGTEAPPLRVTVYTTQVCPHCTTVKNHLRRKGVPYREVDVSKSAEAAKELQNRTGQTGVPQTDINGTFVLGADLPKIDKLIGI